MNKSSHILFSSLLFPYLSSLLFSHLLNSQTRSKYQKTRKQLLPYLHSYSNETNLTEYSFVLNNLDLINPNSNIRDMNRAGMNYVPNLNDKLEKEIKFFPSPPISTYVYLTLQTKPHPQSVPTRDLKL